MQSKLILLVLCVMIAWVYAADKVELRDNPQIRTQLQNMRAGMDHTELIRSLVQGFGPEMTLQLAKQRTDAMGQTHYRYNQLFNNVPVWGEQIIITEGAGRGIVRIHGNAVAGLANEVRRVAPLFSAETALENMKVLQRGASRANWVYENETSELYVYINEEGRGQLCYVVSFFADTEEAGNPTRPYYFVDVETGDVVHQYEGLTFEERAAATGPGGNQKTGKYEYGVQYPTLTVEYSNGTSTMNTTNVKTVNLNHGSSGSTAYSFSGTVNTVKEINGAYSPLNDAHYFGGVVFAVYKDWYNTSPLTFQLVLKVHYSTNYENAFWNGSSMTFGDGATRFYPLVSLDVVAHETSHGFTSQNSNLTYSGQSGGINEAFSDIAGEAAEYYMSGTNDWQVGAQIFKTAGKALRYFDDPTKDGKSIGSAKNYTSGMDVHYSSGVFNKAFYTLAKKPGWNTKKAFDLFVKANQDYWQPGSTFITGAQGVRDAATDYGYSTADVVAAFAAVDVTITTIE